MRTLVNLFITLISMIIASMALASSHVNILVYHHVANDTPASTTISPDQFLAHLQFFKEEGFQVIDLKTAVEAISTQTALPEKAIAITFDDGYEDIYTNAWPLLKQFDYPFTLFVATDAIDQKRKNMLNWDQLRDMHSAGVTIANHSRDHDYLVRYERRDEAWLHRVMDNINGAQERLETELGGDVPRWFAYPYGEFTHSLIDALAKHDYIGFAQHSGGFSASADLQAIPRFAAAGIYANLATLKTKLLSHPMPVIETSTTEMMTMDAQPELVAEVNSAQNDSTQLNCFVDGRPMPHEWVNNTTFKAQSQTELNEGRHRYNCTARSRTGGFYYWYSKPWLVFKKFDR